MNPKPCRSPVAQYSIGALFGQSRLAQLWPGLLLVLLLGSSRVARGEAMLELFNVNWDELIQKMPEIAEAGYDSLWLPPPGKGSRTGRVMDVNGICQSRPPRASTASRVLLTVVR